MVNRRNCGVGRIGFWVNQGQGGSKKTVKLKTNNHLKTRAQQFVAGEGWALRIEVKGVGDD